LPRIAGEGAAGLQLLEDLVGLGHDLLGTRGGGRRREENLADVKLLGALGCVELVDHRLHLVVADADGALDLGTLQALCGDFALNLPAKRFDRRAIGFEETGELLGRLLHVPGDAGDRLVDVRRLDGDLLGLGRLDLKRFVDEVAKDLLAQAVHFVGRNLSAIGDGEKREPLVDVGLGNDIAVDDGGRLDDRGHCCPEHLWIFRKPQRARAVRLGLFGLLRDRRCGRGERDQRRRLPPVRGNPFET